MKNHRSTRAVSSVVGNIYKNDIAKGATKPKVIYKSLIANDPASSLANRKEREYTKTGLAKTIKRKSTQTLGTTISKTLTNMRPTMAGID